MLTGKYLEFYDRLQKTIPSARLYDSYFYRLAKGTDASIYRLIPKLVVRIESEAELKALLKAGRELGIALTFKAAGTSLSGQTVTDSVLVELGANWNKISVENGGDKITMQCGVVGEHANNKLRAYRRKIPPSPASINSAMIGGIVANNASGNSYGIAYNSYNTLTGMKLIFADGAELDTRSKESRAHFATTHPEMMRKLIMLSEKVKSNLSMADKIRHKYRLKNTCGYGLNSLIDFDDPIDMIEHLMVGSEGTLAFISEVEMKTVPDKAFKATSLIFFPDMLTACQAVLALKKSPVSAAELMDRAALKAVEDVEGIPPVLKSLPAETTAILLDTSADKPEDLDEQISETRNALAQLPTVHPITFTKEKEEYELLWNVRRGLFTSASAARRPGTAVVIEDLAFPLENLGPALSEIQSLFEKYHYNDSVIWGHVLDGNFHFVIMQDFGNPKEVAVYKEFMKKLAQLVIEKYDGSLKGEHGTGRNMAPFVRYEWGDDLYGIMKEIKTIFDEDGVLNPGVILNDDPEAHIHNLKSLPLANALIDKCIECGFCEVNCPSRYLTLTPRQRIVLYREMARLQQTGEDPSLLRLLKSDYDYNANQTCATDGLCALACPVDIDTGKLIKDLRFEENSHRANKIASKLAENMDRLTAWMRFALNLVGGVHRLIGGASMQYCANLLRRISNNQIPLWNPYMPKGGVPIKPEPVKPGNPLKMVYFPTCINRGMGKSADYEKQDLPLTTQIHRLLNKAGYEVIYPKNLSNLCCGMAFDSKGFKAQGMQKAKELEAALLEASNNGEYPVLADMSPCLQRMKQTLDKRLKLYEPIEFTLSFLSPRLDFKPLPEKITIHNTCSSTKMGLNDSFLKLAKMCAQDVLVPENVGCCGWAGDRGFSYPELNASALKNLKPQITPDISGGYSTSRTCEIGLSLHSGISYKSIIYLVDRASEPKG
ncbi:MAG TPA: FAD-binding oxidoreductase [Candidatus Marinimicrobia bacterium]|nr:FAD-binding oxidoreductase [Candidatus Neomarinimicrobiota bacterium]